MRWRDLSIQLFSLSICTRVIFTGCEVFACSALSEKITIIIIRAGTSLIHLLACEWDGCNQQIIENSLRSEFLRWIKDSLQEDNADFQKNYLLNKLVIVFCLSIWLYIFCCWRPESLSESVLVPVLFVLFWSHANITVYYLFLCFFGFIQHCCDSLWNTAGGWLRTAEPEANA